MLPSPKNTLLTTYTFERLAKLQIYDLAYYPFGSSMVSFSNTEFHYSFGMNTQEKDDEIYGVGNSYSAEYWQYDARLGRRWNNDPRSNPSVSVYACFGNNPIWFSDVAGDSNIVYLHVLSSAFTEKGGNHSWKDIDNYVTQTNGYFKKMGINMRMEVFSRAVDQNKDANFYLSKMDDTDAVMVFGAPDNVKDWLTGKVIGKTPFEDSDFYEFDKDALAVAPRLTPTSNGYVKGRVIALNSNQIGKYTNSLGGKYSKAETFGLVSLHETGHLSGLGHGIINPYGVRELTGGQQIMSRWSIIAEDIRSGKHTIYYYLNTDKSINGIYLESMKSRFNSSKPSRNYTFGL